MFLMLIKGRFFLAQAAELNVYENALNTPVLVSLCYQKTNRTKMIFLLYIGIASPAS